MPLPDSQVAVGAFGHPRLRPTAGVYGLRMHGKPIEERTVVRVELLPIAVRLKDSREAAVRLTELGQNRDKLLPNLQARHI